MRRVGNKLIDYRLLPMFYNSAVHRDLVTELKQKTGRVFLTIAPDISSGFGFASLVKKYPSVGRPMSINGGSSKSNGVAALVLKDNSPILKEYQTLNFHSDLLWHSRVPNILSMSALLADAFLQIKESNFPHSRLKIDRKRLILNCLQESRSEFSNSDARNTILRAIRKSLEDDNKLIDWFDKKIVNSKLTQPESRSVSLKYGLTDQNQFLRADEFGVQNVYDASVLYEKLTSYSQIKIRWHQNLSSYSQRIYQKLKSWLN
jgi:hypothetical protein